MFEAQGRHRPQLRAAHPPAARRAAAGARRDRLAQPALGRARDRLQPAARRRRRTTSSCRSCAGSATTLQAALAAQGLRVRTYCPVGDLVAGMAYLVRRLLENTSNDSFLLEQARGVPTSSALLAAAVSLTPFANEPIARAAPRAGARSSCVDALAALDAELPLRVPVLIGERRAATRGDAASRPTRATPDRRGRARRASPRAADVDAARASRRAAAPDVGRAAAPHARAEVAGPRRRRAARAPARARRARGPRVREAVGARPTPTSARRSTSSSTTRAARSRCERGRRPLAAARRASATRCATPPRGVVAVIAPWNFPLAIPAGMVAAGAGDRQRRRAQAGRAVAGVRAARSSRRCATAGVPPGALALLPGEGDVGAALVARPARAHDRLHRLRRRSAWRSCARAAEVAPGQRHLKRVVAEMGGKNCVIVDADADLDDVVPAIVVLRLRLRRPEVLGGLARARARGGSPTRWSSASPARSRRCSSARPQRLRRSTCRR